MKSQLFLVVAIFVLASCNSSRINFNSMSDAEIRAYNQTVGQWEQVFCEEIASVRSRVPRRRCQTRLEMQQENVGNVGTLNTAGSGQDRFGTN